MSAENQQATVLMWNGSEYVATDSVLAVDFTVCELGDAKRAFAWAEQPEYDYYICQVECP